MEHLIDRKSASWGYLTDEVKGLLVDGELLLSHKELIPHKISDHSYLVFPFAKAYEGFLKRLFLDLDIIREDEYYGDEIRIGRILNPHYLEDHQNVFKKLCTTTGDKEAFAERLWMIWRQGRNQVFHYFPHNFRKLSFDEAKEIIDEIVAVIESTTQSCYIDGVIAEKQ